MFTDESTGKHLIRPGNALRLMLSAGHEIHCLQGRATITAAPQMLGDNLLVPARRLYAGQGWRSEQAQWVTVRNDDFHLPCLVASILPPDQHSAAPKTNSPAAWATGLLSGLTLWIRRVLRAA